MQKSTSNGLFYRPSTFFGWLILAGLSAYLVWSFRAIDVRSHSASDTLINWIPRAVMAAMGYVIAGLVMKRGE